MANLAQENKDLRDQLRSLRGELARLEAANLDKPRDHEEVERLQRRLEEQAEALARLAREKAHLSGDIGDPPEGMVRFFSPVSGFRCTFPFRKPTAKVLPNGTVDWQQQDGNTVVFNPLPPPWAGSTYDTAEPAEISYLDKLKGISPYVFRRGDQNCPRPERRPGLETATAEVGR